METRKRRHEQLAAQFVAADQLPRAMDTCFTKPNEVLAKAEFEEFVETLCLPFYDGTNNGRRRFRRACIAVCCSLATKKALARSEALRGSVATIFSLRELLGVPLTEKSPHLWSLTRVRDRLPLEVHTTVFQFKLGVVHGQGLLQGKDFSRARL